jgi:CRISPR-associated protein Cas2
MLHVVCYDISDDRTRTRMSNSLLDFGVRIQESVFECCLDGELYDRMLERLEKIPLQDQDRVRIYRVCADCVERVQIFGVGDVTQDPPYYLI